MTAPRAQRAACLAAVSGAVAPRTAVEYDDRQLTTSGQVDDAAMPDLYVLVEVSRRFGVQDRANGALVMRSYRMTTRYVARDLDGLSWLSERVARLERKPLADISSTPLEHDSAGATEYRNGVWEAEDEWTYEAPI